MKAKKIALLGVLTAVSLTIFIIELQIPNPFPVPGIKLGLANIVTVYAVYRFTAAEAAAVTLVRILLGSLLTGNAAALIYSLSGSFLCLLGMLFLRRIIDENHIWLSSVFGAVLHNTGQTAAALIMTQTPGILAYYPFLTAAGCLAGLFTGLCAQLLIKRLSSQRHGNQF